MGRFPLLLPAVFLAAAGATVCTAPPDQAQVPPGAPITVNVTCRDTGPGVGVRVHPWTAHSGDSTRISWHLTPANETMPTVLSPVDSTRWPFDNPSYSWSQGRVSASLKQEVDPGPYHYKLQIACPNDTILIDPIFVVDH